MKPKPGKLYRAKSWREWKTTTEHIISIKRGELVLYLGREFMLYGEVKLPRMYPRLLEEYFEEVK